MLNQNNLFRRYFNPSLALTVILAPGAIWAQSSRPTLKLSAELVLTPDFCAIKKAEGNGITSYKDKFEVGKKLCAALAERLPSVFEHLNKVEAIPQGDEAGSDLVLIPKMGDVKTKLGAMAFSKRDVEVAIEWTALDRTGKTLFVTIVEGTGESHKGNVFTHAKNATKANDEVIKDLTDKSINAIASAPELTKIGQ